MVEDYGIKVSKVNKSATSKDLKDLGFSSGEATYMVAQVKTVTINANPYVVIHNIGYVPKVFVFHILSDHNRKLPYDDGTNKRDFSVTSDEVKIRGVTSGTFKIYIFAQGMV